MINVVGKTNGKPISSLSIDITTPSKEIKVFATRLKVPRFKGPVVHREGNVLHEFIKDQVPNMISCTVLTSPPGTISPVKMEFCSVENAVAAKAKIDILNQEWNGWAVFTLFSNAPVTNPLPPI